jgi:hypothetical protein
MSVEMNISGVETTDHIGISRNYHLLENEITIKLKQRNHINNTNKSNLLPVKAQPHRYEDQLVTILWGNNRSLK